jgi:chromosome transmission fidelity protein 1
VSRKKGGKGKARSEEIPLAETGLLRSREERSPGADSDGHVADPPPVRVGVASCSADAHPSMAGDAPEHPYGFPFPPYSVQRDMMDAITSAIDARSVGLFESPTGTGKTLSVICATMSWLRAHRLDPDAHAAPSATVPGPGELAAVGGEPDWVSAQTATKAVSVLQSLQERRSLAFSARARSARRASETRGRGARGLKAQRLGQGDAASHSQRRVSSAGRGGEARFLPASEADQEAADLDGNDAEDDLLLDPPPEADGGDLVADTSPRLRLIFATRTHTQLAQFIAEVRKTGFHAAALNSEAHMSAAPLPLSVVTFGSRKVMCINDAVRQLPTAAAVSDRCRELIAEKSGRAAKKRGLDGRLPPGKGAAGCCFKDESVERDLRNMAIVQAHDVEELAALGKQLRGCPYFSSRAALASGAVDVIGVPYSAILHKPTRESLGISVDSQTVVVFDEAHNIVDAVNDIHAAPLSRSALTATQSALLAYRERYATRLAPQSLFSVNQILTCAEGLLTFLPLPSLSTPPPKARVLTPSALIFEAKIENLNLFRLTAFIGESRLCQKLLGFVDAGLSDGTARGWSPGASARFGEPGRTSADVTSARRRSKHGIAAFESFLFALNSATDSGRVAVYPSGSSSGGDASEGRLKYFVLNPGGLFTSAVESARAVLLVGGTLSPRQAMKDALLAGLPKSRPVVEFECDHVIGAGNLVAMVAATGPSGVSLEFTLRTRQDVGVLDELGCTALRVVAASPGGVVLFFASYSFMAAVAERWAKTGCEEAIRAVKPLFCETRGDVDVFESYSAAIAADRRRGAVLTAVLGGRLSEGINFSDDLGRVVMVIGMPFANAANVETAEVLRALPDRRRRSDYLENACMTIVNQAIGRAIRHRSDFAAILLCDRRFSKFSTLEKLPRFVRQSMTVPASFSAALESLERFFPPGAARTLR